MALLLVSQIKASVAITGLIVNTQGTLSSHTRQLCWRSFHRGNNRTFRLSLSYDTIPMVWQIRKKYFLNLETRRNRKVKGISPFAFHRNFLIPSLPSFSHLANYDFQGVEPAAPSSDCGHPGQQHVIAGMPAVLFSSVCPQVHSHKLPSSSCAP